MTWFVDKLGPMPDGAFTKQNVGQSPKRLLEKSGVSAPPADVRMTKGAEITESLSKNAPAPEPDKKKKKGWF